MSKFVWVVLGIIILVLIGLFLFSGSTLLSPVQKSFDRNIKSSSSSLPSFCNVPGQQVQQLLNTINAGKNK